MEGPGMPHGMFRWISHIDHPMVQCVGFARTKVLLNWQCDLCKGKLTDGNMRWKLCFPAWVAQTYIWMIF